ncbi:MAG: hypothetical protein ACJ75H_12835 [Thermoanaerobaculia bacterium]
MGKKGEALPQTASPRAWEIYRELDLGPGGYATVPSTETRRGAEDEVRRKAARTKSTLSAIGLFLLLGVWLSACASAGPALSPEAKAAAEPEIYEAVFRYQFDHNASGIQKQAERYCLSVLGEASPDAELLRRFEGNRPPVVAADQCERRTGKNLFFRIQNVDWRSDSEVWVRGGYFEGNLSSSIESYRVIRKDGKWVVQGARMEAIS